ncbi:MAG: beta-galactosidase [Kiritimatiellae bacterium]|nr:beta-galactosidase [Kiritimatiellia bacterium]
MQRKRPSFGMLSAGAFVLLILTPGAHLASTSSSVADGAVVSSQAEGTALPSGAKQVFAEDFSAGGNLTDRWEIISGNWRIQDGALHGSTSAVIALKQELGSNLRLEFTAWSDGDSPCDLDAALGSNGGKDWMNPGCLFQFGGMFNSRNSIIFNGDGLVIQQGATFPGGIVKGRKHRIIAQNNGNEHALFVDGKQLIKAQSSRVGSSAMGSKVVFYIQTSGAIDDVSILVLPQDAAAWPRDEKANVTQCFDFEKDAIGQGPGGLQIEANGGAVAIVDDPTWVHRGATEETVTDKCLSLSASEKPLKMVVPFAPLASGVIELDLNFKMLGQDGIRIGLIDTNGQEAGSVGVDRYGTWYLIDRNGTNRVDQLVHRVSTCGVGVPLVFDPERWHSLRLGFSTLAGTFYGGYNNYITPASTQPFSHLAVIERYLYIDDKPLMAGIAKEIGSVSITVSPRTVVRMDNLGIVGPVGRQMVNGKSYYGTALRDVMGWTFPERKDPFALKMFSVRNLYDPKKSSSYVTPLQWAPSLRAAFGGDKLITEKFNAFAATSYNELLMRQAFVTERRQMLERTACHLKAGGLLSDELAQHIEEAVKTERRTVELLDDLFRAYGEAYVNNRDVSGLMKRFPPLADELDQELKKFDAMAASVLDRIPRKALGSTRPAMPCPLPFLTPEQFKNYEWRDGQFYRDGEPDFVFLGSVGNGPAHWSKDSYEKLKKTQGIAQRIPAGRLYYWEYLEDRSFDKPCFDGDIGTNLPRRLGEIFLPLYWGTGTEATPPKWWMDANAADPDVMMRNAQGSLVSAPPSVTLNFWNPKARQYLRESYEKLARMLKDNSLGPYPLLYRVGWELGFFATGQGESAKAAFRKSQELQYGTIARLNKTWNTNYTSFADINQPGNDAPPSGLRYEFKRFLQQGQKERMLLVRDALRQNTPGVPTMIDFSTTLKQENEDFDLPSLFESCDIVGFHFYDNDDHQVYAAHRQLDSLRKAMGNTLGNGEYGATMNCPSFDEDIVKNIGLQESYHQMMWGQALPSFAARLDLANVWLGGPVGDVRFGGLLLRYMASSPAIVMDRARRIGRIALKAKSVAPDVAILEATSAWHNEPVPTVRAGMSAAALELEKTRFNYGFLYEQLLLDGRQSLKGIQTVIVPAGFCMAESLSDRLVRWTKAGGTLICYGAPGVYNSYGQGDGRLLKKAFPDVIWRKDAGEWRPIGAAVPKSLQPDGETGLYQGELGHGKVFVYGSENVTEAMSARTAELVRANTVRHSGSADSRLDLAVRSDGKHTYVYILNSSLKETIESDVFVQGKYAEAQDLGLQRPVYVPLTRQDGRTTFRVHLAPAEGTLVQLAR